MIEETATVRMTEAELACYPRRAGKVQEGAEMIVEQDHRAVAIIRPSPPSGRLLSECIALGEAGGTTAIPDDGFMKDADGRSAQRSN